MILFAPFTAPATYQTELGEQRTSAMLSFDGNGGTVPACASITHCYLAAWVAWKAVNVAQRATAAYTWAAPLRSLMARASSRAATIPLPPA